jgi:short-subunit dehydrogenase
VRVVVGTPHPYPFPALPCRAMESCGEPGRGVGLEGNRAAEAGRPVDTAAAGAQLSLVDARQDFRFAMEPTSPEGDPSMAGLTRLKGRSRYSARLPTVGPLRLSGRRITGPRRHRRHAIHGAGGRVLAMPQSGVEPRTPRAPRMHEEKPKWIRASGRTPTLLGDLMWRRQRSLNQAVVVITGASSGVGRAAAFAFADHGARLVLASRGGEALEEVRQGCEERGCEAIAVPTDISDAAAVENLCHVALQRFGRVDVWVQAAAAVIAGPFGSESVEEVRRLLDTNVLGNVLTARGALATFQAQGDGVLIIIGSLLGVFPNPQVPLYSMSKYAARGLALNLRQAVVGHPGVKVCLVLPGPVDTPLFERAANRTGRRLRAIPPAYAPERLAATIVSCARRPRRETTVGLISKAVMFSHRLAPRASEWMVARWSANTITQGTSAPHTSASLFEPPSTGAVHGGHRRGRLRRRLGERLGILISQRTRR